MVHATRHRLGRRFLHVLATVAAIGALLTPSAALADGEKKAVYTITNAASGNAVLAFHRAANGALTPAGTFPTGGTGTGAGLGSGHSLVVSQRRQSARRRERGQQYHLGLHRRSRRAAPHRQSGRVGWQPANQPHAGDDLLSVMNAGSNSIDRDAYRANASDPEQDRWYRRMREHLDADPEWTDGELVYASTAGDG